MVLLFPVGDYRRQTTKYHKYLQLQHYSNSYYMVATLNSFTLWNIFLSQILLVSPPPPPLESLFKILCFQQPLNIFYPFPCVPSRGNVITKVVWRLRMKIIIWRLDDDARYSLEVVGDNTTGDGGEWTRQSKEE